MTLLLLSLALAQEVPPEAPPPTNPWAEVGVPVEGTPAPVPVPRRMTPALRLDQARYDRNMKLATAGMVTGVVGLGVGVVGFGIALSGGSSGDFGNLYTGLGVAVIGGAAFVAGAPIATVGALNGARVLRDAGFDVRPTAGWVSVGLMIGGLLFAPAYPFAYLATGIQMAANTSALRRDSPRARSPILAGVRPDGTIVIGGAW